MTNKELIEALAESAYNSNMQFTLSRNQIKRPLRHNETWGHTTELCRENYRKEVRDILSALADFGMSEEMKRASYKAEGTGGPVSYEAAFTASLRALAATQLEGER